MKYLPEVFWCASMAAQLQALPYYWRNDLTHSSDWQMTAILMALWAIFSALRNKP